jgi:hypothetical protein
MQTTGPLPPSIHLHWSPLPPSWIVSLGLILLAVLPHQVPAVFQRFLRMPLGLAVMIGLAGFCYSHIPVLGIALGIFTWGVYLHSRARIEGFRGPVLIKDRVRSPAPTQKRWLSEEILSENPEAIQERTEDPNLLYDEVSDTEAAHPWFDESVMNIRPAAIQDRPVGTEYEYDESTSITGRG